MSFLTQLNGTAAAVVLCLLLLVDEAGVPLPFAPNEGLLLLAGVLIASSAFPAWVIFPAIYLAMLVGMLAGYYWSRSVGSVGLEGLAARLHATAIYTRTQARLRSAGPVRIGLARMAPGLRPYATLVSGAGGVPLRVFLLGALPALFVWESLWLLAGILVGVPIEHLLGRFERLLLRGVVLVLLGSVGWLAIRDVSDDRRTGVASIAPRLRPSLALAVDTGLVVSLVGGLFGVGRRVLHARADGWIEVVVAAVVLIGVLLVGRARQTPGETLFETQYWHHLPKRPR